MSDAQDFEGLVAVVTGGASGIGAAIANELSARGSRVAIIDRQLGEIPPGMLAIEADVTDDATVVAAVQTIATQLGGIDVLINNAGIGAAGNITANDDDEWHRVWDVNVVGIARMTRACLPWLRRSDAASIVNTASVVAHVGVKDRALYASTKGAVAALTLAMAADHLADGIRVNAVSPGTADTPWVARLLEAAESPDAAAEALRKRQPMGRLVSADEVAWAVASLASPRAASTTGTILSVDGGMRSVRV
ncbi:SDR family NAD(P)-dependent oxidoreductase [Microbacterium aoyamense]|nr:SDR family oxidoreductase [Microbacterium aoyamense]